MFRIFPKRLTLSLSLRYESFLKWLDRPITAVPVKILREKRCKGGRGGEERRKSWKNRGIGDEKRPIELRGRLGNGVKTDKPEVDRCPFFDGRYF